MNLKLSNIDIFADELAHLPEKKLLINTINAHSYNIAQKDKLFAKALYSSNILLPDGISIVLARRLLLREKIKKLAGADLFYYEMERIKKISGKCFFLGSSQEILDIISQKVKNQYPGVSVESYSPPYVAEFSEEETQKMIEAVNNFRPDILFIGMTAPKQEKWAYSNFHELRAGHICSIGAVFDFFAGTVNRAPNWIIKAGFEWLFRFLKEPRRLWRRYLLGNIQFVFYMIKEFLKLNKNKEV